jgi:hypothetical protein
LNEKLTEENYNPILDKNLEFLLQFENVEIEHPVFKALGDAYFSDGNDPELMKRLYDDPNLTLLFQNMEWAKKFDKEEKYAKSFINLLRILVVLYATNGWARSRIGWFMWAVVCAANPNSHFPLTWEGCFEPAKWYYAGETQRAPDKEYRINSESSGGFTIPPLD